MKYLERGWKLGVKTQFKETELLNLAALDAWVFTSIPGFELAAPHTPGVLSAAKAFYVDSNDRLHNVRVSTVTFNDLIRPPTDWSGVYVVKHPASGAFYVGSTVKLYRRISTHMSHLRSEVHRCGRLQSLYDKYSGKGFVVNIIQFYEAEGKDTLLDIEQEIIDVHRYDRHLLNSSTNVRVFGKGAVRTDEHKRRLREFKSKSVVCDGVVYPSLTSAAIAIGVSPSHMHKRLNSSDYPTYGYHI